MFYFFVTSSLTREVFFRFSLTFCFKFVGEATHELELQSTPDNSNLPGKLKKGSSYREFELPGVRRK